MPRFLLSPRWLVAHALVAAVAVLFVSLGLWQLRRLEERRVRNDVVAERLAEPPQPLDRILDEHGQDPAALAYRRVSVEGIYDADDEVLLTPRSRGDRPGHHVVTPLRTDDGLALLVERGWVPFELDQPPIPAAAPPAGVVAVDGILVPTQTASRFGASDGGKRLTFLSVVDTDRLQSQMGAPLYPFSLVLTDQQPPPQDLPRPPQPFDLSEGPHLSYALQWFVFAAIVLAGYPVLVRNSVQARREGRAAPEPAAA